MKQDAKKQLTQEVIEEQLTQEEIKEQLTQDEIKGQLKKYGVWGYNEWYRKQQIKNFVSFILLILIEIIFIIKAPHSTEIIFASLFFPLVIYLFNSNIVSSKYSYLGYLEKYKNYGVLHKNTIDYLIDLM